MPRDASAIRPGQLVNVVGGGLTGSLVAVYLARRGFGVRLFERGPDPSRGDVYGGRSINLALAERGIHALAGVELQHRVRRFALPMRGRMVHPAEGGSQLQPYGQRPHELIYSVHRARLNQVLMEAALESGRVEILFHRELEEIDVDRGRAHFRAAADGRLETHAAWPMIGADGAGSRVRGTLEETLGFEASAELLDHGYLELSLPPRADGRFALDPEALHIWPRGKLMMIALPNPDGSFTGTLFMPKHGPASFAALADFAAFEAFMAANFADAMPYLTRLEADFEEHPVGVLGTVRCPRWHLDGQALLIGDAAHAIVPFHGQGMNCGFEDCEALGRILDDAGSWEAAFSRLEAERRPNADAIADMALENYVEMRSSVVDPGYLLRRQLALELERRHPERFVPRYALVMFRRIGYAEAQRRGAVNAAILAELTRDVRRLEDVDYARAETLVTQRLAPLPMDPPTAWGAAPG